MIAIRNAHDSGKMVSAITPVYSELVKFEFPSGFHGVTQKTNGKFFIFEMVPLQETAAVWTQMVTLTGYQGLTANPNITPQSFATAIGSGFQKSCPETFGFQPLGPIHTDGAQPHDGFAVVASCGSVNPSAGDHSETALIVGIKGTSDYYTIQWAERGPGSPQKIDLKDPKWLAHLNPAQAARGMSAHSGREGTLSELRRTEMSGRRCAPEEAGDILPA